MSLKDYVKQHHIEAIHEALAIVHEAATTYELEVPAEVVSRLVAAVYKNLATPKVYLKEEYAKQPTTEEMEKDVRKMLSAGAPPVMTQPVIKPATQKQEPLKESPDVGDDFITEGDLEAIPWREYPKGNGAWVFSRDEDGGPSQDEHVNKLAEYLASRSGEAYLYHRSYRFSGDDAQFIARYPV